MDEDRAAAFPDAFAAIAGQHGMTWKLPSAGQRRRVLILVSKFHHCLGEVLSG